jgi:hypothetical protein
MLKDLGMQRIIWETEKVERERELELEMEWSGKKEFARGNNSKGIVIILH